MRRALLVLGMAGTLLFGAAFALSFLDPLAIERAAREIVRIEVERRVGEKIDSLSESRIAGLAQKALEKTDQDIALARQALRDDIPGKVAAVVSDMVRADCECRKRLASRLRDAAASHIGSLTQMRERLASHIESVYANVADKLMREFRIFTGTNAVAFALLGLVTLFRGKAALQLALPAVVIVGAVTVTGLLYLFGQDWLHTIVFGQYVGWGYSAYLGGVMLMLADVVFNRATASTVVLNGLFSLVGAAFSVLPC